ncbi:MAG: DUF4390 domain-containing protein, partial [Neisseriaceae bacterium]|nr:DUF4390 domain-containing protein [Neisseriaceae bacterium]
MLWYKKINNFLIILILSMCGFLYAEGIKALEYYGYKNPDGEAIVSVLFDVSLPEELKEALIEGVPLNFILDYDLSDQGSSDYISDLKRLIGINKHTQYKLSYHPILNKYQLSMNGYVTNYYSLSAALKALGQLPNLNLTEELGYAPLKPEEKVQARIKLAMSNKDLPK